MKIGIRWIDNLILNSKLAKEYKASIYKRKRAFRKAYFQYINDLRFIRKFKNEN